MDEQTADFFSELEATNPTSSKNFCCLPPLARVPGEPSVSPTKRLTTERGGAITPALPSIRHPTGFQLQIIN